ncbi:unnamed protein product [Didymodactylos carnosus]|uniref:N-acetyltransferase domain-containing protein n=1 Tax=Didymodactylos carnosus TaxID=1234261 RepID=A0A815QEB1_9BILA|nr:unnamed protein product [Didymodactylos carnosus]CAF1462134.1 unnamed protein product [Didymodactylos carnosus]CAF3758004.1 unnamed protein product [Didymodactylos carnosus]CAF4332142.1 unnamed protein product [Didymodactylos carnosus]
MTLRIIGYGTKAYHQMVALRYDVLLKPLGRKFTDEELAKDKKDLMVGHYDAKDQINGCCIMSDETTNPNVKTGRFRQMAVHDPLQRQGIGRKVLTYSEDIARRNGYHLLTMNSRKTAVPFYEKCGYKVCSEEFKSGITGLLHLKMKKQL